MNNIIIVILRNKHITFTIKYIIYSIHNYISLGEVMGFVQIYFELSYQPVRLSSECKRKIITKPLITVEGSMPSY